MIVLIETFGPIATIRDAELPSLCHRPLGVPGEEEQINVVLFVNEN